MRPLSALVPLLVLLAACGHARKPGPAVATPAEQALLQRMTADAFVRIERLDRDAQNRLLITTRQGEATIRYLVVTPTTGGEHLQCVRLGDAPELSVADDGVIGTGPDRRGLPAHR